MKTNPQAWPPRLTWENPVAYGPDGSIWTATEDWLLAEYGPPPQSSTQLAAAVAAAVVAAVASASPSLQVVSAAKDAGSRTATPATDPEADLDEVLAAVGFERAP